MYRLHYIHVQALSIRQFDNKILTQENPSL